MKRSATGFAELRTTRFLKRRIIVGIHIVETDNFAAVAQQTLARRESR